MRIHLRNPHAETQRRKEENKGFFSPPWFGVFARAIFIVLLLVPMALNAQEGFGSDDEGFGDFGDFGFGDSSGGFGFPPSSASALPSVSISGEVSAELIGFYDDFGSCEKLKYLKAGDIFSGDLNFEASGSAAQAVINLKLTPVFDGSSSPLEIDEAYVRAFFGPVAITGGLRKLSWGKADSFGPLDVVNPLDYTDLTKLSDPPGIKIARPMIHASWAMGPFSKLEAVFVPWFQGHKFATTGRWAPGQVTSIPGSTADYAAKAFTAKTGLILPDSEKKRITGTMEDWIDSGAVDKFYPDTAFFKYAQAGMRFTASVGSSDFGFQYYFGRLPRPVVAFRAGDNFYTGAAVNTDEISIDIGYNYYHQIGADFARVIAGFNLRAEAGVNLTKDTNGTNGAAENPAIVWSLGFDRDLFAGINLNLQGTGKVRLLNDQIGDNPLADCEAETDISSTRITGKLSRKFFRDELELKISGLWGIEDRDFLVMPAIVWTRNDVSTELSGGFFGGDKKGELGQYRDNGFIRVILTYRF